MIKVALTDHNDRPFSPESVSESFSAHLSEVAYVLDAKNPLNSIRPNYYLNEINSSNFFAYPSTSAKYIEIMILQKKKFSYKRNSIFLI